MSADLAIGSELAGYRIDALVGRGGMGIVYRAEQLRLGRAVALKVIAPGLASDEEFRTRFERESRLAALIDHPNVVPIYEAGEAQGLLFIAMRWVAGRDLGVLLKGGGPLDPERTIEILAQVASALDAAHGRGLVHRDVKPGNILIADSGDSASAGHVYLTDFGIAKMTSAVGVTRTGVFLGTPDYAAPEQFEGKDLDGRVDVYALGCLFFQCLTGSRPFERTTEVAVMYAHLHDPPPRVSELRSDVGPALDTVLAKGMAKDRDERYATCSELIDAARAAVTASADLTIAAPLVPPVGVVSAPPTVADPTRPASPPPPPPAPVQPTIEPAGERPHRRLAWIAAGSALVAVAVAVALVFTLRGGDETAAGQTTTGQTTTAQTETSATTASGDTDGATTTGEILPPDPVWARVESETLTEEPVQESLRVSVTADGTAIAIGTEGLSGEHDAVFWTVNDVVGSSSIEKQALVEAGEQVVFGIAPSGDGGAVAVGYQQADPPLGDTGPAVWLKADGDFEPVVVEPTGPYEKMNRVASGESEIVAVGAAGPGRSATGPLPTDAAAWVSTDGGASWEREDVDGLRADNYQEMRGVVGFGTEFVAVGYDGKDAAVWRSDGGSWILTGTPGQLWATDSRPELDMRDVVNASRLVAVGDVVTASGDRDGAVWLSNDAEAWERVEPDSMGGPGDQQVLGIAAGDFGLVAVGCSDCEGDLVIPAVWTSVDGSVWMRADEGRVPAFDGSQQMSSVVAVGGSLVATGWNQAGEKRDAAVWTADLTSSGG